MKWWSDPAWQVTRDVGLTGFGAAGAGDLEAGLRGAARNTLLLGRAPDSITARRASAVVLYLVRAWVILGGSRMQPSELRSSPSSPPGWGGGGEHEDGREVPRASDRAASGAQGKQGAPGRGAACPGCRVVAIIRSLVPDRRADRLVLFELNLFWTAHQSDGEPRGQDHAQHQGGSTGSMGRRCSRRSCASAFDRLAALKPPTGDPASNPARAYAQQERTVLSQLFPRRRMRRQAVTNCSIGGSSGTTGLSAKTTPAAW